MKIRVNLKELYSRRHFGEFLLKYIVCQWYCISIRYNEQKYGESIWKKRDKNVTIRK